MLFHNIKYPINIENFPIIFFKCLFRDSLLNQVPNNIYILQFVVGSLASVILRIF